MKLSQFGRIGMTVFTVLAPLAMDAHVGDSVYKTHIAIQPERQGELTLEIGSLSFFRNNEFSTPAIKGYTLPGIRLQPKLAYYPLSNVKLELGAHLLRYWGAESYPSVAFRDIATWRNIGNQHTLHAVPFFRAHAALGKHIDVVFGNLYGGINHNLIAPLYSPELDLTADPEAGLQMLYRSRSIDVDAWVNWESFIFKLDTHQEAFLFGLSSRIKLNADVSPVHFYMPVQLLAHHKGGEIDTLENSTVQTVMNGAIGGGLVWNTGKKHLRRMTCGVDAVAYYQHKGEQYPFKNGYGVYAYTTADIHNLRLKGDFFYGRTFVSIMGYPFYGCVSVDDPDVTYKHTGTAHLGIDYHHTFAPGIAFGADADIYLHSSVNTVDGNGLTQHYSPSTSITFGAYLRINPSFLLKKFKK